MKARWKNLRDCFVRNVKKREMLGVLGAKNVKVWKYTHMMEFLKPHIQTSKGYVLSAFVPRRKACVYSGVSSFDVLL